MTTEDRLRAAMRARASSVEPAPDGLQQIKEKLMDAQGHSTRNRLLGVAAAAAVAAVIVGITLSNDDDRRIDTTGTTVEETTTSTTTTSVVAPQVDPSVPVFPDPSTSRRFLDPQEVAAAFATDLLGFTDLVVGDFMAGDSRSGEVELRAFAGGNPTTVLVRRLEDDTWFVIGANVETIRLDSPGAGTTIASPLRLTGAAWAFEGHVAVRLFADGVMEPIAQSYVTGRGDEMGDFSGEVTFEAPAGAKHGVLVLYEPSAKDGGTVAATVIRVRF